MQSSERPSGRRTRGQVLFICTVMCLCTALAGCTLGSTSAPPTPTATATVMPTASPTPGMPTLSYTIATQAGMLDKNILQGVPGIALPVASGSTDHWIASSDFQGVACTAVGTADPGGSAGHTVYEDFLCRLATGHATGTGTFLYTQVGSTTALKRALIAVDSSEPTTPGAPILSYRITTSQFDGAASLALAAYNGTNYLWTLGTDFQHLACPSGGQSNINPPNLSGGPYYQVFACQLAAGQVSGQGTLLFVAQHMNPPAQPTYSVNVTVTQGR